MVLSTLLSAPSNQEGNSGKRWSFQKRKEPYGGMLIVIGQEQLSMGLSISTQERIVPSLFPNLMQRYPLYLV